MFKVITYDEVPVSGDCKILERLAKYYYILAENFAF